MTRTKIENPDGSGYSIEKMNVTQAIDYALAYSKEFDGPFTVYKETEMHHTHPETAKAFGVAKWRRIGYAEGGKWYTF